ncbi:Uu.00g047680.m01.CDS01 [Anthostomella pinea]|uniref:Uu.00g047680.m01.CDS01 n=1 Tax=Anthostomella pinea TaxID=933095 RepID=A0AAI8YEL6_9PEZI|nr:Uu.00g047680.m01.CDS01 [Anthostomella pinea]
MCVLLEAALTAAGHQAARVEPPARSSALLAVHALDLVRDPDHPAPYDASATAAAASPSLTQSSFSGLYFLTALRSTLMKPRPDDDMQTAARALVLNDLEGGGARVAAIPGLGEDPSGGCAVDSDSDSDGPFKWDEKRRIETGKIAPGLSPGDTKRIRPETDEAKSATSAATVHVNIIPYWTPTEFRVYKKIEGSGIAPEVFALIEDDHTGSIVGLILEDLRLVGSMPFVSDPQDRAACRDTLKALHNKGWAHGDAHVRNSIITGDDKAYFFDFGAAKKIKSKNDEAAQDDLEDCADENCKRGLIAPVSF